MLKKTLPVGIGMLIGLLAVAGTVISPANYVWAKTFLCSDSVVCIGTDGDDTMVGTNKGNSIFGQGGNDNIAGKGDVDIVVGGEGADVVSGGTGNDLVVGANGADKLVGGDGNDRIFHAFEVPNPTDPDGSKDIIDCGLGNDETWINVSVDHDTASGCETVHTG